MKKLPWNNIKTVLLDMDGTLLDLHFDNYFWLEHLPKAYAERYQMDIQQAKNTLFAKYQAIEGTMNWYCVDYWSDALNMDIVLLKEQVSHLIALHPHVTDFLSSLQKRGIKRVLVTNAHPKSIEIKFRHTSLQHVLDRVISAHDLGLPKEDPDFWWQLHSMVDYHPQTTLLIDDNESVLRSAAQAKIDYLLQISRPDSKQPAKTDTQFNAVSGFSQLLV